jgi:23S rRNA (guanosine2251-2'-O)-methyltransferase
MKKTGPTERAIWISGVNPVREVLLCEKIQPGELVLSRTDSRGRELEELAEKRRVRFTRSLNETISELAGHSHHQGAALKVAEFPYTELEDILEKPLIERDPLLVLDSIQDPQNLGAILRSACFLGAKGVIIPKDRSASVTATVIRISAGGAGYVPVVRVTNIARTLMLIKSAGYWTAGLEAMGGKNLYEADLTVPLCLVIGNEQKGIRPLIRKECDILVRIPAAGPLDSLNAASAATVALYEVLRSRLTRIDIN